ncbi:class I SAM-dependent methyltransferase [Pseudomonadota bacterium]
MAKANEVSSEQQRQEQEYWFPYHYVAQFENDRFRTGYLDSWGINYVSTIEFLLEKIGDATNAQITDIGCGDGRLSRELALKFRECSITGIDYSRRAVGLAAAMNEGVANLSFKAIDITADHELGQFDVAILMEVFEHIPPGDTEKFMSSVHRLLKPDSVLHMTVPHKNTPTDPMHFQHFSVSGLLEHLEDKFEVIEIIPFERISVARTLTVWLLCNRFFILNNPRMLSMLYRYYKRKLFFVQSEKNCQRIYVKARARP